LKSSNGCTKIRVSLNGTKNRTSYIHAINFYYFESRENSKAELGLKGIEKHEKQETIHLNIHIKKRFKGIKT
jgi:hypothetical protein